MTSLYLRCITSPRRRLQVTVGRLLIALLITEGRVYPVLQLDPRRVIGQRLGWLCLIAGTASRWCQ